MSQKGWNRSLANVEVGERFWGKGQCGESLERREGAYKEKGVAEKYCRKEGGCT